MLGYAANNSRNRGSTPSTIDSIPVHRVRRWTAGANAAFTVFLEIPINRSSTLIGDPSAASSASPDKLTVSNDWLRSRRDTERAVDKCQHVSP